MNYLNFTGISNHFSFRFNFTPSLTIAVISVSLSSLFIPFLLRASSYFSSSEIIKILATQRQ